MLSIVLPVVGVGLGLVIYYVRLLSVLKDEREFVEKHPESYMRYRWLYEISEKMERMWPVVRDLEANQWANQLSKVALKLIVALLLIVAVFSQFVADYALGVLVAIFVFASIHNGPQSLERYRKVKPYLPIVLPAMMYQIGIMLQKGHPSLVEQLAIPGAEFVEPKFLFAFLGLCFVFVLPYPLAKFEQWFSGFVARITLHFVKDFMLAGVKPTNEQEAHLRKVASTSIITALAVVLGLLTLVELLT